MKPVLLSEVTIKPVRGNKRILLRELMTLPLATPDRLIEQIWGHAEDGGPLTARCVIHKYLHDLRRNLRPPYRIEFVCRGWVLRGQADA